MVSLRLPWIKSDANTKIYWTISVLREADSKTLFPCAPPASKLVYPGRSASIVWMRCSFRTLSTALIFLRWSSVMLPARTAPSQGIGLARILFCRELRYVGGSRDIVMIMSGVKSRVNLFWSGRCSRREGGSFLARMTEARQDSTARRGSHRFLAFATSPPTSPHSLVHLLFVLAVAFSVLGVSSCDCARIFSLGRALLRAFYLLCDVHIATWLFCLVLLAQLRIWQSFVYTLSPIFCVFLRANPISRIRRWTFLDRNKQPNRCPCIPPPISCNPNTNHLLLSSRIVVSYIFQTTMSQNSQGQKPKWGMGNFFQQAVAGVESRLDNILMDEEERPKSAQSKPKDSESTGSSAQPPLSRSPAGCMEYTIPSIIVID